ncbi:MAG: hypothetical protein WCD85_22500, partial [Pantoea agglomerans]
MKIDHTHDPDASSWVPGVDEHADFPVQNIPLGVFADENGESKIGCAIGDWVLDLKALSNGNLFPAPVAQALRSDTLNTLFRLPQSARQRLRETLFILLTTDKDVTSLRPHLKAIGDCEMRLPFRVGDFTDFYVGIHHATNAGKLFRPDNPLLPNYKHVPIGYHSRASSIRPSGTDVIRPMGQLKPADQPYP